MPLGLRDVTQRYGEGRAIVEGVDLTLEEGMTVAITGPSGSGKTTLLSILGGLLRPSEGYVQLDGQPVGREGFPVGTVAWVFQTVNLFGRRTAVDNVALGLLARGYDHPRARREVLSSLSAVGLEGFGDRTAKSLSGGEAQRVGIARALVGSPRFLLADEPTGELDVSSSDLVADALFSARPADVGVVVVTHDLVFAERCERIVTIVDGRLQEQ